MSQYKYRVLVSAPYMQPVLDEFEPRFNAEGLELVRCSVEERLEEADLLPLVGDIHGIICGDDRITPKVIDAAPRLKAIVKWGTGIDSIAAEHAAARGIAVRRTTNAFSEPVGDTVLGYMLVFARNLVAMDREMKAGRWQKIDGRTLNECTLGIIGVGDCGKAVARRARALGMRILGNDIKQIDAGFLAEQQVEMTSKEQLLAEADFVTLHTDLNPTSHHLMNDEAFGRMKPTAVLINASRGPVVEEAALVRALESGRIAGAAMDVFEDEPLPQGSPLRGMDNVLLAPHNANSSPKYWQAVHENSFRMLLESLRQDA
ncbi:MAG: phosphoglycerate dehydrogenase [Desulfarculaceae bacterium]|nr:phosphoglycerate dehydrogenase [Desulfarculaceae bacterium]